MIQLGPRFGAAQMDVLRSFLRELSGEFQYAVEVRHADFFDQGPNEAALHELLRERRIDRCVLKTGQAADRFEHETRDFFQRVRESYLQRAGSFPARMKVIDSTRSPEEIQKTLQEIVITFCK